MTIITHKPIHHRKKKINHTKWLVDKTIHVVKRNLDAKTKLL